MTKKEIILIFILLIIGLIRFFFFIPDKPGYDAAIGEEVELRGIIVDAPDVRVFNQRIVIKPLNQKSNVLAVIHREVEVFYGDEVTVVGKIESPENFITQSGKEFNYKRYLANKDIYFIIKNAEIEIISNGNISWLKSNLFKLRNSFMKNIERVISPPESDLAGGLILGIQGGFGNDQRGEFISTGIIHIVALSGYNITIVADGVMNIFSLVLSEVMAISLGIFVIILFIIMTGATETSIRAGVMAFIMLLGRMTGRKYDAGRALLIAALLMITYDMRVIADMSFQLSFLATAGVLFITPKVIGWYYFVTIRFKLRELISTTTAATISVLPILLHSTGIFSLVSLPTNILILPFIPVTMFFSFMTGAIGFISPTLSLPFALIADILLSYMLHIIHLFASLPFASLNIKSFPLSLTILIYIFLIWWVFKKK